MTSVAQHSHDTGIPSRAAANQHANGNRVKHGFESAAISAQPSHASPASSAPVLNLTAIANPFASLSIPLGTGKLKPLPEKPGYNEAHRYYDEMRQYYASKAYTSAATAELVIVKVRMVTLEPGKKNPTLISVGVVYFIFLLIPDCSF